MANATDVAAADVLGGDPQHLIPNILRTKIYEDHFWLSACFGLNAELLVDRAVALDHVGMTYGTSMKATNFACLVLKVRRGALEEPARSAPARRVPRRRAGAKHAGAPCSASADGTRYKSSRECVGAGSGRRFGCARAQIWIIGDLRMSRVARLLLDGLAARLIRKHHRSLESRCPCPVSMRRCAPPPLEASDVGQCFVPRRSGNGAGRAAFLSPLVSADRDSVAARLDRGFVTDARVCVRACACTIASRQMLQISPGKDIVIEFIRQEDFKYARCLGAMYMRLIGRPAEVYQYLEPLYNDYRKIRVMTTEGRFVLSHVDEFIDDSTGWARCGGVHAKN